MKRLSILLIIVVAQIVQTTWAQSSKQSMDRESIKNMCGCFEVEFRFSETFSYSEDSTYMPSKNKVANALEYAHMVEEDDNKVMIQHLLLVGDESNPYIIKHWRQDWIFENRDFYLYDGDNKWDFMKKKEGEVTGTWTQKVYQVDDSPRYEGEGSWVYVDGKTYWENETNAPLPRREYTKRSDYNITLRRNKHLITPEGWVHDQDNDKLIRKKRKDVQLLAQEKGTNTYTRVDNKRCEGALKWWNENEKFWSLVRTSWDEIYGKNKDLELAEKVDGKRLYEILFSMPVTTDKETIEKTLKSFVK
jgi:hypothetical protein